MRSATQNRSIVTPFRYWAQRPSDTPAAQAAGGSPNQPLRHAQCSGPRPLRSDLEELRDVQTDPTVGLEVQFNSAVSAFAPQSVAQSSTSATAVGPKSLLAPRRTSATGQDRDPEAESGFECRPQPAAISQDSP